MDSPGEKCGLPNPAALSRILDDMWEKFLPEIRERARILEDAGRAEDAGTLEEADRQAARSAAHKLAGTLGMFGLHQGTELARELERIYAGGSAPETRPEELANAIRVIIDSRK